MCFNRADGKLLWHKEVVYKEKEFTHGTNPFCSASPVTDGERVIASYGSAGLVCYDFDGKEIWRRDLGRFEHIWGNASSPILYGDLAILWCGPGSRQFLLAVRKTTGETVWEHQEPGGKVGTNRADWMGSWSTPLILKAGGHDELVLGVPDQVKGFDPQSGKELWACRGLGKLVYTSPVATKDGLVLVMSGFYGPALAVKAGGQGDVTQTHRLWHHTARNSQRVGSAVIVGEYAYILNDDGLAQCFELATGKDVWNKQRVTTDGPWGSMVAAGDRLYVTNKAGETVVFAASPTFKLLAKNPLGERVMASLAVSDGELFIRSYKHLWCIGPKKH
jgi:outer membrane protein assembly factor BamB